MAGNEKIWTAVDRYAASSLLGSDPVMEDILERNRGSGLPALPRIGLTIRLDAAHAAPLTRAFAGHLRAILPTL